MRTTNICVNKLKKKKKVSIKARERGAARLVADAGRVHAAVVRGGGGEWVSIEGEGGKKTAEGSYLDEI